jgi:hypothetical protein
MSDEDDKKTTPLESLGVTDASANEPAQETAAPASPAAPVRPAEPWFEAAPTGPRIRWAGIVWGLIFMAAGWLTVWTLLATDRRQAFSDWVLSLNDGGWVVLSALSLGGLLLVIGLIEGLRAATRGRGREA